MRDYAKVPPQFWTSVVGKALKASGHEAVIVGMYLLTSPHANMIGVYHCPTAYIAADTGLTMEGATKGLQCAIDAGFCTFEPDTDFVFVHEFAATQVGADLDPKDKRCAGVRNELAKVPQGQCRRGFEARYAFAFHLALAPAEATSTEGASKPLASQKQEQEQEQKKEKKTSSSSTESTGPGTVKALPPTCPHERIRDLYHEVLPGLPRVKLWDDGRQKVLRTRWAETAKRRGWKTADEGCEWFRDFFAAVSVDDWLMGRTSRTSGHESWVCTIDYLLSPKGFRRITEMPRRTEGVAA